LTIRAILIGVLLGLGISAVGYFNDWVLRLSYVASDLIPVSVYGLLVLGILIINPLLRAVRRWQFSAAEMAVIVSLMLVACVIPGPGLMWHLPNSLVMPHFYQQVEPGWRKHQLVRYAPSVMLADVSGDYQKDMLGFCIGLRSDREIGLADVPWHAWTRTLSFWLPLFSLSFIAGICLALVVHKQWSNRERLRYPVVAFAGEWLQGADGNYWPSVFRNPRFWMGFLLAGGILLVNGLALWHPNSITIPTYFDFSAALVSKWPVLGQLPYPVYELWIPRLFFVAVGLSYFLSAEISFSVGISTFCYAIFCIFLTTFGVALSGRFLGGPISFMAAGGYVGMAFTIFYIGRRFYLSVLSRAFAMPGDQSVEAGAVWACRIALAAGVAMVLMLTLITGLNWLLAILFVLLTGLIFLVITRISAETGMFFITQGWYALPVIVALLGIKAIGPHMLIVLAMLSVVMTIDPRVCLMPLVANALKLSEDQGIRPQRIGGWMGVSVLLALAVGVVSTLYVQYNYGGGSLYEFANTGARIPFETLSRNLVRFGPDFGGSTGLRLGNLSPDWKLLPYAGVGMAAVLACGAMRLRYRWWPIHPVLFLLWGSLSSAWYGCSFLVGCVVKATITRLGGARSYQAWKPLFVGLIAGEFFAAMFWAIVGVVHYIHTGTAGPVFRAHL